MNPLRRWWSKWGVVDVLALGGGLGLAGAYVWYQQGTWARPLDDLWPNVATEVLGVWLSVRIIGAWLENRDRRARVRDTLTGNLNYLMRIAQHLAPRFENYNLLDLQNEIRFFQEKRELKARLFERCFSPTEQQAIESAFSLAQQIHDAGRGAQDSLQHAQQIRDTADLWRTESGVGQLDDVFNHYLSSGTCDENTLRAAIAEARERLKAVATPASVNPSISFVHFLEEYLSAKIKCDALAGQLVSDTAAFRRKTWAEQ